MLILSHSGTPITHLTQWPHRHGQWQAGRSAMELAKYWVAGAQMIPVELNALLEAEFGPIHLKRGEPEKATPLPPKGAHGPRMHDLWLKGSLEDERSLTICVEAKADESFGETVAEYQTAATKALRGSPKSKRQARLDILKSMIWGETPPINLASLRYQLLSALTGTAIQTQRDESDVGVLLIHVFDTDKTVAANRYKNEVEFTTFLNSLPLQPSTSTTRGGHVLGRVSVAVPASSTEKNSSSVEIYIAKLTTTI